MAVITGGGLRQTSVLEFFNIIRSPNFDWAVPPVFREKPEGASTREKPPNRVALPPAWDDLIHIVPDNFYTEGEQKAKRIDRIKRMRASPVPEWFDNVTEWMTWIDDIEDFLTTVAVVGIPVTRAIAPKLVPYFGLVLAASDIIDLLNIFSLAKIAGAEGKRKIEELSKMNPFGETAKLKRKLRLAKDIPGLGELFEVLQTTSNLFGTGIELGPILGFVEGAAFQILQEDTAIWADVQYGTPLFLARKILQQYPTYMKNACWLTNEEWMHVLTAQEVATQMMEEYYKTHDIVEQVKYINVKIPPPPCLNCITREALMENGIDPDTTKRWPGTNGATHLSYMDIQGKSAEKIEKNIFHHMYETPTAMEEWFMASMISGTAKRVATMAGGNTDDWEYKPTDEMILAMRVVERGVYLCDGASWDDWFDYLYDIWNTSVLQNGWTSRGQNLGSSSRVGKRCSKDVFTDPPTLRQY
jgi:hypothetical protein